MCIRDSARTAGAGRSGVPDWRHSPLPRSARFGGPRDRCGGRCFDEAAAEVPPQDLPHPQD
eukprot:4566310-Pyramimonas_sp.AAC.1